MLVVVFLVGVLSPDDSDEEAGPTQPDAVGFVNQLCRGGNDFSETRDDLAAELEASATSDVVIAKANMLEYTTGLVDAADAWTEIVRSAPLPDLPNAREIAAGYTAALDTLRIDLEAARSRLEGTTTTDPTAFRAAVDEVDRRGNAAIEDAADALTAVDADYPSDELNAALEDAAECEALL